MKEKIYEVEQLTPGEEIRIARLKKGDTLVSLANRITRHGHTIYPSTLSRLENNKTISPGADLLIAIATALELEDLYFVKKYFDQNINLKPGQKIPEFMERDQFSIANFKKVTDTTLRELKKAVEKIDKLEKTVKKLEEKGGSNQ